MTFISGRLDLKCVRAETVALDEEGIHASREEGGCGYCFSIRLLSPGRRRSLARSSTAKGCTSTSPALQPILYGGQSGSHGSQVDLADAAGQVEPCALACGKERRRRGPRVGGRIFGLWKKTHLVEGYPEGIEKIDFSTHFWVRILMLRSVAEVS